MKKRAPIQKSRKELANQAAPITIQFAAVRPSPKMLQLKKELGVLEGGVIMDTRHSDGAPKG